VFPELKGVVRDLYDEDSDWPEILPGIIDAEIVFPSSASEALSSGFSYSIGQ
jgi:hypothetical protein